MPPASNVLLPLYIYPLPGAWEQLYRALSTYPNLSFTVILNPRNGPGASVFPDPNYSREIPKLNAQPNITTVGYVRTNYCRRSIKEVCQDVKRYAGWSTIPGLGVRGVFFDETPNLFSSEVAEYLEEVNRCVKGSEGMLGERLVIHNPGTVPDAGFATSGPDATTVVEESFAQYKSAIVQERLSSLLPYGWSRCCYIVHSVPREEIRELVMELRERGRYLFVTESNEDFYVKFGESWVDFVEAMQVQR
ncbi:hypothetical protein GQ43DRAFT_164042 [Delitschia confertaspora ATCC 74209]|uniref:Cell surface protein n=1 Tax=Delitschia confertaspora ATCC 74209 TaxID=1513339 RepID=A0A9P4JKY0_9PLEO|nr:hypothetical protein GQ43DRAFT_164042 [Delitschia confertaspora ATCC 74209]